MVEIMATVNFSVPEEVKKAFNRTFKGQNKSAVIAALMREAVERAKRKQLSHKAIENILARRRNAPVRSEDDIRTTRENNRP